MGPKHRMSVTAIGRCAAPITSRITPPTPVLDPPKGSIAEGWLCVSAFTAMVVPGENDTMPAFPTYALRRNGASIAVVAFRSCCNSGVIASPWSPVIRARKVLWAQCSLHVWASVSSSTSVGARPALRKCSAMACSSAGSSEQAAVAVEGRQRIVVESLEVHELDPDVGGRLGIDERRLDGSDRPSFDDRVGEQPLGEHRHGVVVDVAVHLVASACGNRGDGRTDCFGGERHGLRRGIGDTGQQRGLDSRRGGDRPLAGLQHRIDQERVKLVAVAASSDKHQVSDVYRRDFDETERMRIGQQTGGAGVCGG